MVDRTPEDDLWMEMHYEAGQLNMYHIRSAFKRAGYGLEKLPEGHDMAEPPYSERYEEIVERLVELVGGGSANDWDRFILASHRRQVGPVPSGVQVVEQQKLIPETIADMYVSDPTEIARPKPELHPDGVLFWTNADGWEECDIDPVPSYAHKGDAGLDLACVDGVTLKKGDVEDIPLGVSIQPPPGMWYLLHGRSSAINRGLHVFTGIIDFGYRGPLFARVMALKDTEVEVGDRLVQAVLFPLTRAGEVAYAEELADHTRGVNGFGSTGV